MKTPEELFAALGNRGEYSALPSITLDEVRAIYAEGKTARRSRVRHDEKVSRDVIHKLRLAINEAIANSGGHSPEEWEAAQVELCRVLEEVKVMLGEKGDNGTS